MEIVLILIIFLLFQIPLFYFIKNKVQENILEQEKNIKESNIFKIDPKLIDRKVSEKIIERNSRKNTPTSPTSSLIFQEININDQTIIEKLLKEKKEKEKEKISFYNNMIEKCYIDIDRIEENLNELRTYILINGLPSETMVLNYLIKEEKKEMKEKNSNGCTLRGKIWKLFLRINEIDSKFYLDLIEKGPSGK
jgi:hypothetical protein